MNIAFKENLTDEVNTSKIINLFKIACDYDDSDIIKKYLNEKILNPCDNEYELLKYAVMKKCKKIVDEIVDSTLFFEVPNDTKFAIRNATIIGDYQFVGYMLK